MGLRLRTLVGSLRSSLTRRPALVAIPPRPLLAGNRPLTVAGTSICIGVPFVGPI
jgi:hypothetical protein